MTFTDDLKLHSMRIYAVQKKMTTMCKKDDTPSHQKRFFIANIGIAGIFPSTFLQPVNGSKNSIMN